MFRLGVNALTARVFGTWTLVSSMIRFYGAFHLRNAAIYQMTIGTFLIALLHFVLEVVLFKSTSTESVGLISPLAISSRF